jgi:glycosyltransferase involved in cell wall biosynthesis
MANSPLVSTIIIFLNGEQFIEEAIDSVFAQSFDGWELLLVDDGSSDGSTEIARRYAHTHPDRVRYLEHDGHQNRGASASRNLGIAAARGEYIAFLDADDVWLPHKLEQQVALLAAHPEAAMVYGPSEYWYSWTGAAEDAQRDFVQRLGVEPNRIVEPPELLKRFLRKDAPAPCPSDVLVRREVARRIGGFEVQFHGIYQLFEDQVFFAKLCLHSPVFVASECWDRYRQHEASCVVAVKRAGQYHTVRRFYLDWLEQYLAAQGERGSAVWDALQEELWPYRNPLRYRLRGYLRYGAWRAAAALGLIARSITRSPARGKVSVNNDGT